MPRETKPATTRRIPRLIGLLVRQAAECVDAMAHDTVGPRPALVPVPARRSVTRANRRA